MKKKVFYIGLGLAVVSSSAVFARAANMFLKYGDTTGIPLPRTWLRKGFLG